jgi:hypothetical protein
MAGLKDRKAPPFYAAVTIPYHPKRYRKSRLAKAQLGSVEELPKLVLIHSSGGIDRTGTSRRLH